MALTYQPSNIGVGVSVSDVVTLVAFAQQVGSPILTRFSYQPLREVIHAINNNTDIFPRKYLGSNLYQGRTGTIITLQGEVEMVAMEKVAAQEGEDDTYLGSIISCLSVPMSRTQLSSTLATTILMLAYGDLGPNDESSLRLLEGRISKYASASLSRDSMCNKKEHARRDIMEMLKKKIDLPEFPHHAVFLPPRSPGEEFDYVHFLLRIMTSKTDNEIIYVRSIKLLGLSLLLYHYAWSLSVAVEDPSGNTTNLASSSGGLLVIFSLKTNVTQDRRSYIENYVRPRKEFSSFYATATSRAINMDNTSAVATCDSPNAIRDYLRGYDMVNDICNQHVTFGAETKRERLFLWSKSTSRREFPTARACGRFIRPYFQHLPHQLMDIVVATLYTLAPDYDWDALIDNIIHQPINFTDFLGMVARFKGERSKLWLTVGVILGLVDRVVKTLINVDGSASVRMPATPYVDEALQAMTKSLGKFFDTGSTQGQAVLLCAIRLCGGNPSDCRPTAGFSVDTAIGYWNGEQGILPTTVFERKLYCDLSPSKARPFTLYNIPILGMPTDELGWIRPGAVDAQIVRENLGPHLEQSPLQHSFRTSKCHIAIEYRPYFERDTASVVGAAYINGVYHSLLPVDQALDDSLYKALSCEHQTACTREVPVAIDFNLCEPGGYTTPFKREGQKLVGLVGPQTNHVSRFFSTLLLRGSEPVVQKGCLECAFNFAQDADTLIIIPELDEDDVC